MRLLALAILLGAAASALETLTRLRRIRRCEVCRATVNADPLEPVAICRWHWGQGGDA